MLELTGVDPLSMEDIDPDEKNAIEKLVTMVFLISSQVILISDSTSNGLNDEKMQ
jgi:hypothetical protein